MSAQGLLITVVLRPAERQWLEPLIGLLGVRDWEELVKIALHALAHELLPVQEGGGQPPASEASSVGQEPLV